MGAAQAPAAATDGRVAALEKTMLPRALWGIGGGGTLGALYGVFGRCARGSCAMDWNATLPVVAGAVAGLFVVLASRWD